MENQVSSGDAYAAQVSETEWRISSCQIEVDYCYHVNHGLCISRMINTSWDHSNGYVRQAYSILPFTPGETEEWALISSRITSDGYGGHETVQLSIEIRSSSSLLTLHAVAFPGTPVLRQWFDIQNISESQDMHYILQPARINIDMENYRDIYYAEWFVGGKASHDQGSLCRRPLTRSKVTSRNKARIHSDMTCHFVPLMLLMRETAPKDGLMVAMDYVAAWDAYVWRDDERIGLSFDIDGQEPIALNPGQICQTPAVTLAVYIEDRDNLMRTLYDWQYTYLWDYTNNDYFAKIRSATNRPWVYCSRNLHEQYAYRLAYMDIGTAVIQRAGADMVWDDAGWAAAPAYPEDDYMGVFHTNYEGPDHRMSQRFFRKCGLKWLIWFSGKPDIGVLATSEGAWGVFEWRTDALENNNHQQEHAFKQLIRHYLEGDVRRSFHTCSGGSMYSHTFDIIRYSSFNYMTDLGGGFMGNYYFSYFETPDKWYDGLVGLGDQRLARDGSSFYSPEPVDPDKTAYMPEFFRARLTMVPAPGGLIHDSDIDAVRIDNAIYHYLCSEGVAGRYSYVYHPVVFGYAESLCVQRTSRDRLRACIILRRTPDVKVFIFPKALLPEQSYAVCFQNAADRFSRSGADLMENGIQLDHIIDGELVYLNLDPWAEVSGRAPQPPSAAVMQMECNIGCTGVGVYWTPCNDSSRIISYEIARNGETIVQVSTGHYYFDYESGWNADASYCVRAVGNHDLRSGWTAAQRLPGPAMQSSALGGHGPDLAANGWHAEYSADLETFLPMEWIAAAAPPGADYGGTPNQPGGIEGYWQAGRCARVGRGWQQASDDVFCIRSFKIGQNGKFRVSGRAMKEWFHQDAGCTLHICILLGNKTILPWQDLKTGDLYGSGHDFVLDACKGDQLRFVLDKCDQVENPAYIQKDANLVGWILNIQLQSENAGSGHAMRVNCGGEAVVDDSGNIWQADSHCMSGEKKAYKVPDGLVDSVLFSTGCAGSSVCCRLPAPAGIYSLRLCFAELEHKWNGSRVMDVAIGGHTVDRGFDIAETARGTGKVVEKVYCGVVPDANGTIEVSVSAVIGDAVLSAIELADENRDFVHINCGSGNDFIDWSGCVWQKDAFFIGGDCMQAVERDFKLASPTLYDRGLYFTGRTGKDILYRIPVKSGIYSVQLKFAELWLDRPGERKIDIRINNRLLKSSWDAFESAGQAGMSANLRFDNISPANGQISVSITAAGTHPAILQAIEIE